MLLPAVITGVVIYPLWHNAPYSPRIWPLALAVGWAQALALWDYVRGQVMSWQPSRGPGDATRRFWWGVTGWNGTLALAWLGLAGWRMAQTGSLRFAVVAGFGSDQRAHRRPPDLPREGCSMTIQPPEPRRTQARPACRSGPGADPRHYPHHPEQRAAGRDQRAGVR